MSETRLLLNVDFLRDDAVRESLTINISFTGDQPSDKTIADIVRKEVAKHLEKHSWVPQ